MSERIKINPKEKTVTITYPFEQGFAMVNILLTNHVQHLAENFTQENTMPSEEEFGLLNELRSTLTTLSGEQETGRHMNPDPISLLQLGLTDQPTFFTREELVDIAKKDDDQLSGLRFVPPLARFYLACLDDELRDGPPPDRGRLYPNPNGTLEEPPEKTSDTKVFMALVSG